MRIAREKLPFWESESLVNYEICYRGEGFAEMLVPKHAVRPSIKLSSNAESFRDGKKPWNAVKRMVRISDLPPKLPHAVGLTNRAKMWPVKAHILNAESNKNGAGETVVSAYQCIRTDPARQHN